MCQKGKKLGANRRFYRRVIGPEYIEFQPHTLEYFHKTVNFTLSAVEEEVGANRDGDTIIPDKGYYGYKNYTMGISRFKVIPAIFPRKD